MARSSIRSTSCCYDRRSLVRSLTILALLVGATTAPTSGLETSCPGSACCLQDFTPGANCTANDLTFVLAGLGIADDGCVDANDTVSILLRAIVENTTSQTRYDVGIWIATDGDPNADGALTGMCAREILAPASGVQDSLLCTDLDLTCGAGPYYDADLDSCGDLRNQGSAPDCGSTDDVTLTGDGPCTATDGMADASVLDFATPVVFACNDSDLDGFANLDICLSYGNQPNQVDFGGANSQCDSAAEIEPGTAAKCQCEDNFNTNIPAADLDLSCSCAGSTIPGGFTTCTLSYSSADLAGCTPDLGTQERFRCGSTAYVRFNADYDENNLSVASATTMSGSASDDGAAVTWDPASGFGTSNIIGEGESGNLVLRFDVDAMASAGTYSTAVSTLWSNNPGFGASTVQPLSTTCSFSVGPTFAPVSSVAARADGGGVWLSWETAGELESLGFEVERWQSAANGFAPVSTSAIPALGDGPGGHYRFYDVGAPVDGPSVYRLAALDRRGSRVLHGPFTVVPEHSEEAPAVGSSTDQRTVIERGWDAVPKPVHRSRQATPPGTGDTGPVDDVVEPTGRFARLAIEVEQDGLVVVDRSQIALGLGWSEAEVASAIDRGQLSLSRGSQAIAWQVHEHGGLAFFGQALDSIYTAANVYWLEPGEGRPIVELGGAPPQPVTATQSFRDTVRREQDLLPRIGVASDPESDYWFWSFVISGNVDFGSTTVEVDLPAVAEVATEGVLAVDLWGFDAGPHRARVRVAGVELGEISFSGAVAHRGLLPLPQGLLSEGPNTLELEGIEGVWFLDGFDFVYQRRFEAEGDRLILRSDGAPVVSVRGFESRDLAVYDLSDPQQPRRLRAITVDSNDGAQRVSFEPSSATTPYLVVGDRAEIGPARLRRDRPSRWLEPEHRVDYLVLAAGELLEGARDLADYRAAEGLRTAVVDLQDLYDEVADGIATPEAVRAFLEIVASTWQRAPRYVVLVGDGHYDYRGRLGLGGNAFPPLMVPTAFGLVPSDNRLADPGTELGVPKMAVGRLPVDDLAELRAYLAKIAALEASDEGAWRSRVALVGDNTDAIGDFTADGERLAALLAGEYQLDPIYLFDPLTLADARRRLQESWRSGLLAVGYSGHGGIDRMAGEGLLLVGDVDQLDSGARVPTVAAASCFLNFFAFPGFDSLGETLVKAEDGGAAAVVSASGLSAHPEAVALQERFLEALLVDRTPRLGDALLKALTAHAAQGGMPEMLSIVGLLGDPALRLPLPN